MHVHIVMDRNGDTRHEFDPGMLHDVSRAEDRFRELTGLGFRAVALGRHGAPGKPMQAFDARVEETLFIPQLQGG